MSAGILRQSTSQDIRFGPFVDSSDGFSPETALTITQSDMQLSKDGGTFTQKNAAGNATHDTDGWYSTTLNATDTDTVGILIMQVNATGALPVWVTYQVLSQDVYDSLYASGATGYLKPTVAGRTLDITASGAAGIDWGNVENQSTSVILSSTTTNLVNTTTTNTDMRGTDSALLAASAPANFGDLSIEISTGLVDITQSSADKAWVTATRELTGASGITNDGSSITMFSPGVIGTVNTVTDKAGYFISGSKATLDALQDLSASQVNSEMVDVMTVDTYPEPSSPPPATSSLKDKIGWAFSVARNKITQTATTQLLRNDGDSASIGTSTVSDDGTTFTRGKFT